MTLVLLIAWQCASLGSVKGTALHWKDSSASQGFHEKSHFARLIGFEGHQYSKGKEFKSYLVRPKDIIFLDFIIF